MDFETLFNDAANAGFGCVLFDMQEDETGKMRPLPGKGWASVNGEKAFRINSPDDLDTDAKWITNLDRATFWKTGCVRVKKLRESSFLKTDLGHMMREAGLVPRVISSASACEGLAEIFARTMRIAHEHYDLDMLRESEFVEDLRPVLVPQDTGVSLEVDEALSRAYIDFVPCPSSRVEGERVATLRRPRLAHAKEVLASAIPSGAWEFLGPDNMPEEGRLEWLLEKKRPGVAKIALRGFLPGCPNWIPPLLQLGEAIGAGGKRKERNWMTLQEIRYFAKYAKVSIQAVFLAEGWELVRMGKGLPDFGEMSDFSFSLGLLAETHWQALAMRSRDPVTRSKSMVSPRACWLKAADRFLCFASAMPLAASGFAILNYGSGIVSVRHLPEQAGDLLEIAKKSGLIAPAALIDEAKSSRKESKPNEGEAL